MRRTFALAFLCCASHGALISINNTDDWETVNSTSTFQNLDNCTQSCIQSVNQKIWDVGQSKFCESQGCVCSNSTEGENFLNGKAKISSCVMTQCGAQAVDTATKAFEDLCLILALNSTRPPTEVGEIYRIEAEGYSDLTNCAKFVVNGCMDVNGTRNEADCGPRETPTNWELYKGIADQRSCNSSQCLCDDGYFDTTVAVALDAGQKFCAMRPTTKALPNPEANDLLNVLATYCFSYGFPQRNFTYTLRGRAPGSEDQQQPNAGMSVDSRAQIGIAAAALLISIVALYPHVRVFLLSKSAIAPKP